MTILNNGSIRTGDCVVMWDGINRPEAVPATADKPASQKFTLKLAFPPDAPTYGELYQESEKFTNTKYPQSRPRGFEPAFRPAEVPELPGWIAVNAATFGTAPEVFDIQGRSLAPAEYGRMLYAGAKIQAILTPRVYDANGNRGAGFWLGGVLIVDANAPRLSIAAGMSQADMRSAFGLPSSPLEGAAGGAPVAGTPVPGYPTPPAPGVAAPVPPAPAAAPAVPPTPPAPGSFPAPPAPAGAASSATTSPSNGVAVAPNYGMLQPPVPPAAAPTPPAAPIRQMTPAAQAAGYTYDSLAGAGWNDAQMIQAGYLVPA